MRQPIGVVDDFELALSYFDADIYDFEMTPGVIERMREIIGDAVDW
jgi:hypothetical protein